MNHRDIEVRSTGRESVLVSKAPHPPLPTPPVFCMPYGAAPSGCFSLNSPPPPTPNLRFWLRSLAILTATTGFTSSLCVAPPTNLPLSLLREPFVIAIGFNVTAAHLCERDVLGCGRPASLGVFLPEPMEEEEKEEEDVLSPHLLPLFYYTYLLCFHPPDCSRGSGVNSEACEGPATEVRSGSSMQRKGGRAGGSYRWSRSWKWDRMGRSILEHIGLSLKYVSPAVPAVFYSRCLLLVPPT